MITPQPKDIEQTSLQGTITGIPLVQNIVTTAGSWYAIELESESKQLVLQPRAEVSWKYAAVSGGDYITMRNGAAIQAPVVAVSGTVVGWVSCDTETTFELLVGR